jgi:hypothetical protein
MHKLTLSVNGDVVGRAKRYASKNGTSVSRLVENYLDLVARPSSAPAEVPPVLAMLRGAAKGKSTEDYGRYLTKKYR